MIIMNRNKHDWCDAVRVMLDNHLTVSKGRKDLKIHLGQLRTGAVHEGFWVRLLNINSNNTCLNKCNKLNIAVGTVCVPISVAFQYSVMRWRGLHSNSVATDCIMSDQSGCVPPDRKSGLLFVDVMCQKTAERTVSRPQWRGQTCATALLSGRLEEFIQESFLCGSRSVGGHERLFLAAIQARARQIWWRTWGDLHCQDAAHKMTMFTERFSCVGWLTIRAHCTEL